jgi:uncharacterized SAM-binding protein YcdF (DUF218 family)
VKKSHARRAAGDPAAPSALVPSARAFYAVTMFLLGKILGVLAFPPGLFLSLALLAVLLLVLKRRKTAILVAALDFLALYFLSTTAVASLLIAPLENKYPPLADASGAQVVIVLGGGYNDVSPEYEGQPALAPESEKRAIYGLELSRRYKLPLIYSGGASFANTTKGSQAEAAERLWQSLGVPSSSIALETASFDTKTNASGVAALTKGKRGILVTSAFHMPRSMLSFQRMGMDVVAAPTDYKAKRSSLTWADYLPNVSAMETSAAALHEYVGLPVYRLSLRAPKK